VCDRAAQKGRDQCLSVKKLKSRADRNARREELVEHQKREWAGMNELDTYTHTMMKRKTLVSIQKENVVAVRVAFLSTKKKRGGDFFLSIPPR